MPHNGRRSMPALRSGGIMISAWMTTPSVVPNPSSRMCGSVMVPG